MLGVSAFYHDSAACLVADGAIVAAAQEERFTRVKHDARFPEAAIRYCLDHVGIEPRQLDYVAFYEKPLLKLDRLIETYLGYAPRGFRSFLAAIPTLLGVKVHVARELERVLKGFDRRWIYLEHHLSHAASAFFPSPFSEAAILTLDGVGEWSTGTIGIGRGSKIEMVREMRFPHSLGLLYSAFTQHAGFKVNSGEYKLMGLAPHGEPRFADIILDELVALEKDGSFRLNLDYFDYCAGLSMTNRRFADLFEGPARANEAPITDRDRDLAASIQAVTEEIVLRCAKYARSVTGARNLCLAGGVALNCVANGAIRRARLFDGIWVQPAAGDAGAALGAALLVWHQLLDNARKGGVDRQSGSFLGPSFDDDDEIAAVLREEGVVGEHYAEEDALLTETARLLAGERVVGHVHGRMEFGPRALGARSILADPRSPSMRDRINDKVKYREAFRPLAPSVLKGAANDWFELDPGDESPYMVAVAPLREDKMALVPSVVHIDRSSRVQTIDPIVHPRFHRLLSHFAEQTGCPMLINTSLNVRGEPLACTPRDAVRCFLGTDMDALVVGNHLLRKEAQPESVCRARRDHHRQFARD